MTWREANFKKEKKEYPHPFCSVIVNRSHIFLCIAVIVIVIQKNVIMSISLWDDRMIILTDMNYCDYC